MNESETYKLINKQIDGEISEQEQASLDQILHNDEVSRRKFEKIQQTVQAIENMPLIDPPPALAGNIMAQISAARSQKPDSLRERISTFFFDLASPPRRMAIAFVSGILIGAVCVGLLIQSGSVSTIDISGTIGIDNMTDTHNFTLQATDITAEFTIDRTPDGIKCQAQIITGQTLDVIFTLDSPSSHLDGYQAKSDNPVYVRSISDGIKISLVSDTRLQLDIHTEESYNKELIIKVISPEEQLSKTILFN